MLSVRNRLKQHMQRLHQAIFHRVISTSHLVSALYIDSRSGIRKKIITPLHVDRSPVHACPCSSTTVTLAISSNVLFSRRYRSFSPRFRTFPMNDTMFPVTCSRSKCTLHRIAPPRLQQRRLRVDLVLPSRFILRFLHQHNPKIFVSAPLPRSSYHRPPAAASAAVRRPLRVSLPPHRYLRTAFRAAPPSTRSTSPP